MLANWTEVEVNEGAISSGSVDLYSYFSRCSEDKGCQALAFDWGIVVRLEKYRACLDAGW